MDILPVVSLLGAAIVVLSFGVLMSVHRCGAECDTNQCHCRWMPAASLASLGIASSPVLIQIAVS